MSLKLALLIHSNNNIKSSLVQSQLCASAEIPYSENWTQPTIPNVFLWLRGYAKLKRIHSSCVQQSLEACFLDKKLLLIYSPIVIEKGPLPTSFLRYGRLVGWIWWICTFCEGSCRRKIRNGRFWLAESEGYAVSLKGAVGNIWKILDGWIWRILERHWHLQKQVFCRAHEPIFPWSNNSMLNCRDYAANATTSEK